MTRKKTQRSAGGAASAADIDIREWRNEALAILCFAFALYLSLTLLVRSYGEELPALKSFMGPIGGVVGTLLTGMLGWCALVPVVYCLFLAVAWWQEEEPPPARQLRSRILGCFALAATLVLACGSAALFWGRNGGGSIGTGIAEPVSHLVGTGGALLAFLALLLLSFGLATRLSVEALVHSAVAGLTALGRGIFVTLPAALWVALVVVASPLVAVVRRVGLMLFGRSEPTPMPRPRMRKNIIKKGDAEVEDDRGEASSRGEKSQRDDDDEEEVPGLLPLPDEEIVVKRREPEEISRKVLIQKQKEREAALETYTPPDTSLLTKGEVTITAEDDEELRQKSRLIEAKLKDFGILGRITEVHPGPVITLFEFEPAPGVKVGRIASLQDDLAMSLRSTSVRIIAPIPRKGTVGIEVPNKQRDIVRLRDVLESSTFLQAESTLSIALGKDTNGEPVAVDIAAMPHLLIAGATGTGKSVCINAILLSLLYRCSPAELGLIMIDPKILELSTYEDIPHLKVPVVTVPRQAKAVLEWAVAEMNRRYRLMQRFGVRNIDGYNRVARGEEEREKDDSAIELKEEAMVEPGTVEPQAGPAAVIDGAEGEPLPGDVIQPLPKIVIVIDELADLMLTVGKDIEDLITRLAQKARAAGIHLMVATQRPSVDVITGLIKANFPARLSFQVTTRVDSRTILDCMGAEKLLGKGDMLFMSPGAVGIRRLHGAFVSDAEVKRVVTAVKKNGKPRYDEHIMAICQKALEEEANPGGDGASIAEGEYDEFYDQAVQLVLEKGQASTSMIQRVFRIGYNRAARIIEVMEKEGIVGPMDGAKPRQVLLASAEGSDV